MYCSDCVVLLDLSISQLWDFFFSIYFFGECVMIYTYIPNQTPRGGAGPKKNRWIRDLVYTTSHYVKFPRPWSSYACRLLGSRDF